MRLVKGCTIACKIQGNSSSMDAKIPKSCVCASLLLWARLPVHKVRCSYPLMVQMLTERRFQMSRWLICRLDAARPFWKWTSRDIQATSEEVVKMKRARVFSCLLYFGRKIKRTMEAREGAAEAFLGEPLVWAFVAQDMVERHEISYRRLIAWQF